MDKIVLFSVFLFLVVKIRVLGANVPDPVAFFPLNAKYGTKEIKDRSPEGVPHDVNLAPGPDGQEGGSYEFDGTSNSYIEFPNSEGGTLDVRYSITMLCWAYYEGVDGPLFFYEPDVLYKWGVHLATFEGKLYARFHTRTYLSTDYYMWAPSRLASGWSFVGASYDGTTGKAKLWVDGEMVQEKSVGAGLELGTQDNARMGTEFSGIFGYFKGMIAQMRLFDVALTQEQVQEIKGVPNTVQVPGPEKLLVPWKDLGCWREKQSKRVLPELLVNLRSEIHPCNITETIELCYQAAKNAGKRYFTVKRSGNCLAADDGATYKKYGPSKYCWFGVGGRTNNQVYEVQ